MTAEMFVQTWLIIGIGITCTILMLSANEGGTEKPRASTAILTVFFWPAAVIFIILLVMRNNR